MSISDDIITLNGVKVVALRLLSPYNTWNSRVTWGRITPTYSVLRTGHRAWKYCNMWFIEDKGDLTYTEDSV